MQFVSALREQDRDFSLHNLSQVKIDYGGPKKLTYPRKLEKQSASYFQSYP